MFRCCEFFKILYKKPIFDFIIFIIILILSFWISFSELTHYRLNEKNPLYLNHQLYYEPAVLVGCKKGFGVFTPPVLFNGDPLELYYKRSNKPEEPALNQFLKLEVDSIDCQSLPNTTVRKDPPQGVWYYLLSAVGYLWRITGVSWQSLDILTASFFAICMGFTYAVFRLGMNRLISVILTCLLLGSTLQLTFLPWMRDYAKAPFFLAVFFLFGVFVTKPFKPLILFILSALTGLVIGVGVGIRSDLFITLLPAILTILFFIPGKTFGNIPKKLTAIVILVGTFYLAAIPIINASLKSGNCGSDHPLAGLMAPFSQALKLKLSPIYEIGSAYNDLVDYAMVGSHAAQFLNVDLDRSLLKNKDSGNMLYVWCTPAYDAASSSLVLHILSTFPADMLIRSYKSAIYILNLGFLSWQETSMPPWQTIVLVPTDNLFSNFYKVSRTLLSYLQNTGPFISLLAIFLIGIFHLRIAIFLFLALLYFSMYPVLQYNPRSFFHLEFISLWILGFLINQTFHINKYFIYYKTHTKEVIKRSFLSAIVLLGLCTFVMVLLPTLQYIQTVRVKSLISEYENSKRKLLIKSQQKQENDQTLIKVDAFDMPPQKYANGEMLFIELKGTHCANKPLDFTLEYDLDPNIYPHFNISKTDKVQVTNNEKAFIYTPIYQSIHFKFKGIKVKTDQAQCVGDIYKLLDLKYQPLWLFLKLTPNWQNERLYQSW